MAQESWKMDKDETGCQPPEGPILCANNCGFFGSAATMNLCSQCYRDFVLKQTNAVKAVSAIATVQSEQPVDRSERQHLQPEGSVDVAGSSSQPAVGEATLAADSSLQPPRQAPNRCFCCKKRVGLTGFNCRCGNVFCSLHRYSDKHNCQYDYKTAARDAIAKANPLVKADKIDKI